LIESSTFCILATQPRGLYGSSILSLDFNGDNIADFAMAAPRSPVITENGGAVSLMYSLLQ